MNLYFLTLACLCAGLLFDPVGFLRLTLLASVLHEAGHVIAYVICTKKTPPLKISVAGICLQNTCMLSNKQDFFVTLSGPLTNLILALCLHFYIQYKASYGLYFFMAINICVAIYNLLPVGALDGARLISIISKSCKSKLLYSIKKILVLVFFIVSVLLCFVKEINLYFKIALVLSSSYLLFQENKSV